MILGGKDLQALADELVGGHLKGNSKRESAVKGSSIDVRIGEIAYICKSNAEALDLSKEYNFEDDLSTNFEEIKLLGGYKLKNGATIYTHLLEYVTVPNDMCCFVNTRSSLARIGLNLPISNYVNPGYTGHLPIIINNISGRDVIIPAHYTVAQLVFMKLTSASSGYSQQKDSKFFNEQCFNIALDENV